VFISVCILSECELRVNSPQNFNSVSKRNETELLVIVWMTDRLLVWTNAARAVTSENRKKTFEFATEVITSLRDLVRNIHISPLLMDQTALTWKPERDIVP